MRSYEESRCNFSIVPLDASDFLHHILLQTNTLIWEIWETIIIIIIVITKLTLWFPWPFSLIKETQPLEDDENRLGLEEWGSATIYTLGESTNEGGGDGQGVRIIGGN